MKENNYHEILSVSNLYLEDSYVLGFSEEINKISIHMDIVVLEGHKKYEPPLSGEHYCYKKADLKFENCKYKWLKKSLLPTIDANNEIDYGNIDIFYHNDNVYYLEGNWGILSIKSETLPTVNF